MPHDKQSPDQHLTVEDTAAFARAQVAPARRPALEAHLTTCVECRREVAHVVRILRAEQRPRTWRYGALAAAAAVLLVVIARPDLPRPEGVPPLRADGGREAVIDVVLPNAVAAGPADARYFVWRSVEKDARYEFRITAADGMPLWSSSTSDTSIVLPPDIQLAPDRTYVWFVDALRPDGRSVTSGVRSLRTSP